ncbi:MAG: CocE/NonD family hydrolase [Gemmatimonadota bacterium]|nr:CocE/NonD family hydrolase [Gemmatimonadota bacterium]
MMVVGACNGDEPVIEVETSPLSLEGTSPVEWTGHERSSHFVTASDGVRLAVDVVLPAGYTGTDDAPTAFPVIFRYTPYHRTSIVPGTGEVPVAPFDFFLARGYAYVAADMRGSGASFGWNDVMTPMMIEDGGVIVDWIAAQPWSDGNVGMFGGSYEGWSQFAAAAAQPEALKAIIPIHTGWDGMLGKPGGIFSYAFIEMWTAMTDFINHNNVFPTFPIPPVTPVLDEDGDGELLDEIPVDADGDTWFTDDYAWPVDPANPPRYPDGAERTEHAYFNATMEHIAHPDGAPGNYDAVTSVRSQRFHDTQRKSDGISPADMNWSLVPGIIESGVAIYHYAGWWDAFTRSSFEVYATLAETNPSRIAS